MVSGRRHEDVKQKKQTIREKNPQIMNQEDLVECMESRSSLSKRMDLPI